MSTYERVKDGQVVERVITVPNSHEDNRLGVAALQGDQGWRVVEDQAEPDRPAASTTAPAQKPADETASVPKPRAPREG